MPRIGVRPGGRKGDDKLRKKLEESGERLLRNSEQPYLRVYDGRKKKKKGAGP